MSGRMPSSQNANVVLTAAGSTLEEQPLEVLQPLSQSLLETHSSQPP